MKTYYHYREWELQNQVVQTGDRNELSDHGKEGLAKHLIRLLKETKKGVMQVAPLNFRSRSVYLSPNQAIWLQQTLRGQDEVYDAEVVNGCCLDIVGKRHGCVRLLLACSKSLFDVNNNTVDEPPTEAETRRDDTGATEGVQEEDDQPSAKPKPRMTAAEKRAASNRARMAFGYPPLPPLAEEQQAQPPSQQPPPTEAAEVPMMPSSPSPTEVDALLNGSFLSVDPSVGPGLLDATAMDEANDSATPAQKTVDGKSYLLFSTPPPN